MKFIPHAVAVQLLFVLVQGTNLQDGGKRVACYYAGEINNKSRTLLPEDINATLCTHLLCFKVDINVETGEIEFSEGGGRYAGIDYLNRVLKLKEINPELKVLLNFIPSCLHPWISNTRSGWSVFINKIIEFIMLHGFDGVEMQYFTTPEENYCYGELLCEMRAEFDKHGLILTTTLPTMEYAADVERDIDKINRCCDFITVLTVFYGSVSTNVTRISTPLPSVKSHIDVYIAKGFSAKKLLITIPAFGMTSKLKNLNETSLGAKISGRDDSECSTSIPIKYRKLMVKFGDSSEQWTIRRDEATNSPYAFNIHGLWASYDDPSSVATKAQYVLDKKLGGATIMALDLDDFMGIAGEGRFPLTRKLHDIIIEGKENETHTSAQ